MLLILLQFFLCRMFLLGHGRLLGLYVVYVYWLFLFFPFFSLVAFLLLLFVSFIIFVVCLPFFCCCDFYFFAFCEHGHANLWFNILFSYLFFRLFFFWVFHRCSGQRRWRYVWGNLLICFYIILRFHKILI